MTENIYWVSAEHKQRFTTAMQKFGKIYNGKIDPEYGAALYILTSRSSTWDQAEGCVNGLGINFEDLFKEARFSGAYSVLIEWASGLFNGNTSIVPNELMRLDDDNFQLALQALRIRRYGVPFSELHVF